MIKSKQMTPKGLEMIAVAKKTGTWDALEEVQASIIPKDLKDALLKNKKANEHFQSFPPSSKRIILELEGSQCIDINHIINSIKSKNMMLS